MNEANASLNVENAAHTAALPRYDWHQSYDWNYENAPAPSQVTEPPVTGRWDFCGLPVRSPLGIAAGPLLNRRWILYYASLGFDVLTYKTVRSSYRACYPMPNLQPVISRRLNHANAVLPIDNEMNGSWAVSFGMPSKSPDVWRADVEATRRALPPHKILSVSVVATPEPDWTRDDLVNDFAQCAKWAVESGADCVEANFSCPNVSSADGQLYQQPEVAGQVAAAVRGASARKPVLLKIGHITEDAPASELCRAVAPHVNALVMVNCVSASVINETGHRIFNGQKRGIAGDAIREAALEQVRLFARAIRRQQLPLQLVGVGGIATAEHVRSYLDGGSHAVQFATAAMLDPAIALRIRSEL